MSSSKASIFVEDRKEDPCDEEAEEEEEEEEEESAKYEEAVPILS